MKVLLVEDSEVVIKYVQHVLASEPDIELLPPARDGAAGVEAALRLAPDVILMDLGLPVLDGIAAITEIMRTHPTPIVVLSGRLDSPSVDRTFESLAAGAVDVLAKPAGLGIANVDGFRARLVRTLRVMAQACVVARGRKLPVDRTAPPETDWPETDWEALQEAGREAGRPLPRSPQIVLIGTSTGGPQLLDRLLRALPAPFPLPIVIAQHIMVGFEDGLARWLAESGHQVEVVRAPRPIEAGRVYLAPADRHLAVTARGFTLRDAGVTLPVPSADVLFGSAAEAVGAGVVALLLTGMGADGAEGLLALRQAGARTIAQAGETCVVDGMPQAARRRGAACEVLGPEEMIRMLLRVGSDSRS